MTLSATTDATPDDSSALDENTAAQLPTMLEYFNADHADVVDVVARAHTGLDSVDAATITAVDRVSVTVTYSAAGATSDVVVPLDQPIEQIGDVWSRALELAAAAREQLGITELTTAEQRVQAMNAIRTYVTSVVRAEQVTPHFREITFGGGDLDTFQPGGLDSFIYVLVPPPGRDELTIDNTFTWTEYEEMPEAERPVGAYYTLRRWRPAADGKPAEIDMLFLLHDEGHATTWAARAKAGDPVALWGPRTAYEPPADTDWLLLAADETGLPAVSVILENKPDGMPAEVFVELDGPADQLPLPESPDITVRWLSREGAPAGTTTLLADAVARFELRPGKVYAWGGAESRAMTAIRKYLRRGRGIEQSRVTMVGYWRHPSSPEIETDD